MKLCAIVITVLAVFRKILAGFRNQIAMKFQIQSPKVCE